jgi:hypothetical protein
MKSFKNYKIVPKVINKDLALFLYNYISLKREVNKILIESKFISPWQMEWGVWEDQLTKNTYCHYGDLAMETLLMKVQPIVEKETNMQLQPNYSYVKMYKTGDDLFRHTDRFACEISVTMNLGGDPWPIYVEPSGKKGKKGVPIHLGRGDMLIYRGDKLEHWREPLQGKEHVQVFLHYNNVNSKDSKDNLYDARPLLGLPQDFKRKRNN